MMVNGSHDYALGKGAATDRHVIRWLERLEMKLDRTVWVVAGLSTVMPVLMTLLVLALRGEIG